MVNTQGVLVCGEVTQEKISSVTAELMTTGKKISNDLKQPLGLLLIGQTIQGAAKEGIFLGAHKVYTAEGPSFAESHPDLYVALITEACKQIKPATILFSQTEMGRDIAPRLGARLRASICLDCIDLTIDPETRSILLTKPVYGGNALAVWASDSAGQHVITLRPRAVAPAVADSSRKGEIVPLKTEINAASIKGKLLETVKEETKGIKLEEAKVIVAGGGGIGSPEGFQLIQELAQVLHGAVGISRVPKDEGWMPSNLEIGQTGHFVSPDLYIAVGISGAPQHLAGCSSSKCIVAINKDSDAHIFKEADFGVVGDYKKIIPPFIEKIKTLLSA